MKAKRKATRKKPVATETLLLEIGTEEIPAGYIQPALEALSAALTGRLDEARIGHGAVRLFGTPRRLAVEVAGVSSKQAGSVEEIIGPPKRVGYDAEGRLTLAGEKFAEKAGVDPSRLEVKETERGAYLCARRSEAGRPTRELLGKILPEVILKTPFPKSMRWADLEVSFARPIHSLLALLGKQVVPFVLGNVKSGRTTFGHRFLGPARVRIEAAGDYVKAMRRAHVIVEPAERRKKVEEGVKAAAAKLKGKVLSDPELLDIVTHLVEYPAPVAGSFDTDFLEVPDEVLINAMREHQKYFAVLGRKGRLMAAFIAVNNTPARSMKLVAKGHERVLRARLSDARFFFRSDLQTSQEDRVERLKGVLFQARLGTLHAKAGRVQALSEYLARCLEGPDAALAARASRAARLCKSDLVSQVVGEFPKLQGVMGRIYAERAGEDPEVAAAIEEHYRPTASGGVLPATPTGAVLALADKMDTLCGCFSAGLIPTGASDPYALRRQGVGILQILRERGFAVSLEAMVGESLPRFENGADAREGVLGFLRNRMVHLLTEEGFPKDVTAAVTGASIDIVPAVWKRAKALDSLRSLPDFEPLAIAFKRVMNIIRKAEGEGKVPEAAAVDESLFQHGCEGDLLSAYREVRERVAGHLQAGAFDRALLSIASLRGPVDAFFDGVMVMAEDPRIRDNRLALLGKVAGLFTGIADFSRLST